MTEWNPIPDEFNAIPDEFNPPPEGKYGSEEQATGVEREQTREDQALKREDNPGKSGSSAKKTGFSAFSAGGVGSTSSLQSIRMAAVALVGTAVVVTATVVQVILAAALFLNVSVFRNRILMTVGIETYTEELCVRVSYDGFSETIPVELPPDEPVDKGEGESAEQRVWYYEYVLEDLAEEKQVTVELLGTKGEVLDSRVVTVAPEEKAPVAKASFEEVSSGSGMVWMEARITTYAEGMRVRITYSGMTEELPVEIPAGDDTLPEQERGRWSCEYWLKDLSGECEVTVELLDPDGNVLDSRVVTVAPEEWIDAFFDEVYAESEMIGASVWIGESVDEELFVHVTGIDVDETYQISFEETDVSDGYRIGFAECWLEGSEEEREVTVELVDSSDRILDSRVVTVVPEKWIDAFFENVYSEGEMIGASVWIGESVYEELFVHVTGTDIDETCQIMFEEMDVSDGYRIGFAECWLEGSEEEREVTVELVDSFDRILDSRTVRLLPGWSEQIAWIDDVTVSDGQILVSVSVAEWSKGLSLTLSSGEQTVEHELEEGQEEYFFNLAECGVEPGSSVIILLTDPEWGTLDSREIQILSENGMTVALENVLLTIEEDYTGSGESIYTLTATLTVPEEQTDGLYLFIETDEMTLSLDVNSDCIIEQTSADGAVTLRCYWTDLKWVDTGEDSFHASLYRSGEFLCDATGQIERIPAGE